MVGFVKVLALLAAVRQAKKLSRTNALAYFGKDKEKKVL